MINNSYKFFWACDYKNTTGEGKLARMFISHKEKRLNCEFMRIIGPSNFIVNYKYISPFIGIIYCWFYYLKKKEVYYINYLPFWNFFLFALLPPKTKFGPITGGAKFSKDNKNIIRKIIFPIFFKISEFLINIRQHFIFSTDLLKKKLSEKTIKKSEFNFIFKFIKIERKINGKKIDFLIYNRNHPNKKNLIQKQLIKKLILYGFDVRIIGDNLNFQKIKNYGYISNQKVKKLLKKTYFTIPSEENIYSIFILECIENNVKILVKNDIYNKLKYYKKSFIKINYKKIIEIKNIKQKLKNNENRFRN